MTRVFVVAVVCDHDLVTQPTLSLQPVFWDQSHVFKNSETNMLYLYSSAVGYLRTGNQTYLQNAKKVSRGVVRFYEPRR